MLMFPFVCSVCVSVHCYLSSPCNYILYCYEHIVCIDSAQFDAILDNLNAFYCICLSAVFSAANLALAGFPLTKTLGENLPSRL